MAWFRVGTVEELETMGIHFACPNGHPLHVKVELSGKRAICPHCQAKFLIPKVEDLASPAVSPTAEPPAAPSPSPAEVAAPPRSPVPAPPASPSPPAQESGSPVGSASAPAWYVRPAAGGQFGPADERLMRQWAGEGRIAADAYVWQTGWADWRRAGDAAEFFPQLQPPSPPSAPPKPPADSSAPTPATVAQRYQRHKRQAAQGQAIAAIALVVLAATLGGVLLWVMQPTKATPDSAPSDSPPPASAPSETPIE